MSPPTDLSSEYAMRAARGGCPPEVDGFVDPWSEGPLIRYMAHLRHQYSHIGISHPRSGAPIELDSIFVERRLGIEPGGGEAGLSVVDLLELCMKAPQFHNGGSDFKPGLKDSGC